MIYGQCNNNIPSHQGKDLWWSLWKKKMVAIVNYHSQEANTLIIGDVANWKRHQQLDEILISFYPHYIGEIGKVVKKKKKTLSCNTPAKINAILFAQHTLATMRAFHTA